MSVEVLVPEMGESVLEATVTEWLKQEGDYVNVGEALLELETDKVNLEVGAKSAGVLEKIKVKQGEDVKVGDVLALIDEKAAQPESPAAEPKAEKKAVREKEMAGSNGHAPAREYCTADHPGCIPAGKGEGRGRQRFGGNRPRRSCHPLRRGAIPSGREKSPGNRQTGQSPARSGDGKGPLSFIKSASISYVMVVSSARSMPTTGRSFTGSGFVPAGTIAVHL